MTKSWEFSLTGGKIVNTLTEVMVGSGARGQSGMDGRYGCPDTDNQLACYDPGYLGKPLLNVKLHYHDRELSTKGRYVHVKRRYFQWNVSI